MYHRLTREIQEWKTLLRSVPSLFLTLFAASVVIMNLLANKSINLPWDWLALDCGIIVSWVSFLCMDIAAKHFGPKAATRLSLTAVFVNLLVCLVLFIASLISGMWGEAYVDGSEELICNALDRTIGGTWYVLLGSTIAFIVSAVVNNFLNYAVGKLFRKHPDGFAAYACRSYVSTAIAQFADNLVFALLVSHFFFGWTMLQCITCAITGMIVELLCEVIFSPIGYRVSRKWKTEQVGKTYFELVGQA
ncbi:MAG: VUT family protein [Parasporobacterium sp.]|nr:VUT family protein [Parasporobacterium sp.]